MTNEGAGAGAGNIAINEAEWCRYLMRAATLHLVERGALQDSAVADL